jgi:hypothetical protein
MLKWILSSLVVILLTSRAVFGMTSTNYTIDFDSLNSGGDDISSSTNYQIRDTIGEQATGFSSSTGYSIQAGYRQGDDVANLSFDLGTQENSTRTPFSEFSSSTYSVEVDSVASFSTSSFIGVVENEGLSQVVALGRIVAITGTTITVDQWDGDPGGISTSTDGGDDYVYRLEGSSAQLGTLTTATGKTSLTHTDVTTNASGGYTVYVASDGKLRVNASTFISDVSDGSVTIGSEEYGAIVTGDFGTSTSTSADFALTTSTFAIQTNSAVSEDQRVGLIYKASIAGGTAAGSYSQLLYYTVTANF